MKRIQPPGIKTKKRESKFRSGAYLQASLNKKAFKQEWIVEPRTMCILT